MWRNIKQCTSWLFLTLYYIIFFKLEIRVENVSEVVHSHNTAAATGNCQLWLRCSIPWSNSEPQALVFPDSPSLHHHRQCKSLLSQDIFACWTVEKRNKGYDDQTQQANNVLETEAICSCTFCSVPSVRIRFLSLLKSSSFSPLVSDAWSFSERREDKLGFLCWSPLPNETKMHTVLEWCILNSSHKMSALTQPGVVLMQ